MARARRAAAAAAAASALRAALSLSLSLSLSLAAHSASAAPPTALRCASAGLSFSGIFTDNAVLQRAPQLASLYGCAGNASAVAGATVLLALQGVEGGDGGGAPVNLTLPTVVAGDGSWKVTLPRAFATGGNFSASISCAACPAGSPWWQTISNVVFGDVFVCSGQSNMRLPLLNSFTHNATVAAIAGGAYSNVRVITVPGCAADLHAPGNWVCAETSQYGCPSGSAWCPLAAILGGTLSNFAATCLHFGLALTDLIAAADEATPPPPIGLYDISEGGSQVEHWTSWEAQTRPGSCRNATCLCPWPNPGWTDCPIYEWPMNETDCGSNAIFWNSHIEPLLNMSIKGALWYQ